MFILFFHIPHMWYHAVFLFLWFILLNIIPSNYPCCCKWQDFIFFLMTESYSLYIYIYIHHLFVTHSSGDELWSCSHILTTINNVAMDMSFPGHSDGKASACNAGDLGSILGSERSPGEGNGYPPQYSCLENPMESPWQAAVHRVAQSWTRLKQLSTHARVNMACCVPFQISLSVFFRYRPRSRAVRSHGSSVLVFSPTSILFSTVAAPLARA